MLTFPIGVGSGRGGGGIVRSAAAGEAVLGEWMRQTLAVEVCEFA